MSSALITIRKQYKELSNFLLLAYGFVTEFWLALNGLY